jgi:hypothetical protein
MTVETMPKPRADVRKIIGDVDFQDLKQQRPKTYAIVVLDLSVTRSDYILPFTGTYVKAIEATDQDANIDIVLNEAPNDTINVTKGRALRTPFYRIYITNAAQAGKTLTLGIGVESATFRVEDEGVVNISGSIRSGGADGTPVQAIVSVTNVSKTLVAANGNRRTVLIQNHGTNPLYVGITTPATTANCPILLQQYQSVTLETTAIVYGIRGVAAAQNVGVLQEVNA